MMTLRFRAAIATIALAAAPMAAFASTPFAGDDFDSDDAPQYLTRTFTPDNSGNDPRGTFGGSFFDRFGIVQREQTVIIDGMEETIGDALPFDVLDDSAGTFADDDLGIIRTGKLDQFVYLTDTDNGNNPGGAVSAVWTFDISGRSNIELSIDMAMAGDLDAGDDFRFRYSIDGGPNTVAFDVQVDEINDEEFGLTDSGILYGVTMEGGTSYDRYGFAFFDENDWNDIIDFGPTPGVLEYHPRDDGTDGDTTAEDGFIPVTFAGGTDQIRAYTTTNAFGTFDEQEFEPYRDPLFVNPTEAPDADGNNFATGQQLTNDFQKITVPVAGTGNVLTLIFDGVMNGSQEAFVFDNIVLAEGDGPVLTADFNGDGVVDLLDLDILGQNFGMPGTPSTGDATGDGQVDLLDLDELGSQFGMGSGGSAIPEPTAALIAAGGAMGLLARRRG